MKRLNEWAEETTTGDRDELVPGVSEQAWRQVAVTAKECLGAQRCPQGAECFAELARAEAGEAHIVVTNHALLAIDALEEFQVLPEHDVVIVDEAHELVDRVTSVATGDLNAAAVETAARRCGRLIEEGTADRLKEAAEGLGILLEDLPPGRIDVLDPALGRRPRRPCGTPRTPVSPRSARRRRIDPGDMAARKAARLVLGRAARDGREDAGGVQARDGRAVRRGVAGEALRPRGGRASTGAARRADRGRRPPADDLFERRTAILTSATLTLGGSFEPLARQWGLPPLNEKGAGRDALTAAEGLARTATEKDETPEIVWSGLDVGSPFDHAKAASCTWRATCRSRDATASPTPT